MTSRDCWTLKNQMALGLVLTFLSLVLAPVCRASAEAIQETLNTVTDQVWANKTPGIQVGLWVPGQGEWEIAKGLSDLKRNKPMKVGMQQPIGSITKTMTGTLILQLVEEGKLSLDDPLSKWYSEAPQGDQITIAMLLNMTSGIARYNEGFLADRIYEILRASPHTVFQHELLAAHGLSLPRVFDNPGRQDDYSSTNTLLLGEIAEKVTGQRYPQLLRERLFKPLGMTRSFLPQRGGLRPPFCRVYETDEDSGQAIDATPWSTSWSWAAGGLASTLEDARRWGIALGTGHRVLSPDMQALRSTVCGPDIAPIHSKTSNQYCLGVLVTKDRTTGEIFSYHHSGSVFGAEAQLAYYPRTRAVLVVMTNGRSSSEPSLAIRVADRITEALPSLFGAE